MNEAVLIDLIQYYPHLFDKSSNNYKNNIAKENSWRAISLAMGQSVEDCQRVWRNLREKYSRERKIRNTTPSGTAPRENEWSLFKNMSFMDKHIGTRNRISNINKSVEDIQKKVTKPYTIVINESHSSLPTILSEKELLSPRSTASSNSSCSWNIMSPVIHEEVEGSTIWQESETEDLQEYSASIEIDKEQAEVSCPVEILQVTNAEETQKQPTPKRRRVIQPDPQPAIVQTLSSLTSYLEKKKTDSSTAFGHYVAAILAEMSEKDRNYKKMKIMEILHE